MKKFPSNQSTLCASALLLSSLILTFGCSSSTPATPSGSDAGADSAVQGDAFEAKVGSDMQANVLVQIDNLVASATALQQAAPITKNWTPADITKMQGEWVKMRAAYERIEGAVAPLFSELDTSMDQRYDAFVTEEIKGKDANLFDGEGVTGMHAIERILWADTVPMFVTEYEKTIELNGTNLYVAPSRPMTDAEAKDFKEKLCQRMVDDAKKLQTQWKSVRLDLATAYTGLRDLMQEQVEKVTLAASGQEESRYSQKTMSDLRGNLEGTKTIFAVFKPWIQSKSGGAAIVTQVEAGFAKLDTAYAAVSGDAIPQPPATWQAEMGDKQSAADLATPFGKLYLEVSQASDAKVETSVAAQMGKAADMLGFKEK
jgi:iron uptake system component EfeO